MNEIWREIDGFPDYRVSNTGKVKSIKHNKELILKPSLSNGYQVVPLYNNKSRSKTVLCVETGCVYPSTREVERQTGFDNTCISDCCRGKRKVAYGYHWKYL